MGVNSQSEVECPRCDCNSMEKTGFDNSGHWVKYICPECGCEKQESVTQDQTGVSPADLKKLNDF